MKCRTLNLAMWSGPRNLSTALMRSFAQRTDCQAWDEPFYAAYLTYTGISHPMREEIIEDGMSDPANVIAACIKPPASPKTIFFQKHMTMHMTPNIDLDWMGNMTNAFLIRSPERVLASYAKKRETVSADDLGFKRQREMFDFLQNKTGVAPIVIDSSDIRRSPEAALRALCRHLEIDFDPSMLSWRVGPAKEDGIWGKHWYDIIWKSTKFAPPDNLQQPLEPDLQALCDEVMPDFEYVKKHKIQIV
jgi:hypothetical protein